MPTVSARRTAELGGDICLVLDQLEELFLYHGAGGHDGFARELAEIVTRPGLRVSVLLGIREDALAQLDAFKAHVPNLFGNYLRLDRLDRPAGRAAISARSRAGTTASRPASTWKPSPASSRRFWTRSPSVGSSRLAGRGGAGTSTRDGSRPRTCSS